jgi:methylated-DNA-[protein]-cysteine S-methyltransferase
MEVVMSSPIGNISIHENGGKITNVHFTDQAETLEVLPGVLEHTVLQLKKYFNSELKTFDIPIAPKGTEFQKTVWHELSKIPYGTTISYQMLANRLGNEKVIRASASANGKNPIAIIIPCHRVIGSDGRMTGYAGGIERKKKLLKLENAPVLSQTTLF